MPQQPSTSVMAAFIAPKQPNKQLDNDQKKPTSETGSPMSSLKAEKPPLAQPEPDFDESVNEKTHSVGFFLEEDDSKRDTIKRCPAQ